MSPRPDFFGLFDWVVEKFKKSPKNVVVLHGPRAYGKGECLQVLRHHLKDHVLGDAPINGRNPEAALSQLKELLPSVLNGKHQGRWIQLDNLDAFFGQTPAEPPARVSAAEIAERVYICHSLLQEANRTTRTGEQPGTIGMVVTTTRDPADLFEPSHIVSSVLLPAEMIKLAHVPGTEWRDSIRRALACPPHPRAKGTARDSLHVRAGALTMATREELAEYILEQGDSHPALMLAGLSGIGAWLQTEGAAERVSDDAKQLRFAIRTAMLEDGSTPARRQLRRLRSSSSPVAQHAFQVLRDQLLHRPSEPIHALPNTVNLLMEAGLLRPVDGELGQYQYRVAGGILREVLYDSLELALQTRVVFREVLSDARIDVEVVTPDGVTRRGSLTGNSFLLGTTLVEAGGDVVSFEAFKIALSKREGGAALSEKGQITALNRFLKEMNKLAPAGQPIIENIRGVGYRLVQNGILLERV